MAPGYEVEPASIDGSADLLIEIAAVLYQGRLDRDLGTLCRGENAHADVAKMAVEIAQFADDQHGDLVLLLMALSTKLKETNRQYLEIDAGVQDLFDRVLTEGQYRAPTTPGGTA